MSPLRATVVLVLCAGLLTVRPVWADGVSSRKIEAKQHYTAGLRLYNVSQFAEALVEFKEAYLAYDDPAFLYNIAQCHRLLGNKAEAITYYTRFLGARPDSPEQGEVKKMIAELKAQLEAAPGADVKPAAVAEPPVATVPPPTTASPPVSPPPAEPTTAAPPAAGEPPPAPASVPPPPAAATVDVSPPPASSPPPPVLVVAPSSSPVSPDGRADARARYRVAALTTAAVGLVSAGVGGLLWLSAGRTFDDCQNKGGCLRADEPRGEDTAGVVLFWSGSALAVAGGAAFVLLRAHHPGGLAWLDHVAVDPGRAVWLGGSF